MLYNRQRFPEIEYCGWNVCSIAQLPWWHIWRLLEKKSEQSCWLERGELFSCPA